MNYYHPTTLEHIRNSLPAVAEWAGATALPVPDYDPQTQQCMFVDGVWKVEAVAGKTNNEIIKELTQALEAHYDAKAQERRYDNRLTCALRAGYAGPFQAEGQAFAVWMDTCNAYGYQVMRDILAKLQPVPTAEELIAELPTMVWPA
jgi:hypothetical protein